MPILPSIRPISPLSNAVTAQANSRIANENPGHQTMTASLQEEKAAKKIGRQLSVASNGNHYADIHRQEAERALNGDGGLMSPPNGQKESFFSHLRSQRRMWTLVEQPLVNGIGHCAYQ
jgi:meiosis induction protein kinase IME2/SME1